jgi:hypothetical protein
MSIGRTRAQGWKAYVVVVFKVKPFLVSEDVAEVGPAGGHCFVATQLLGHKLVAGLLSVGELTICMASTSSSFKAFATLGITSSNLFLTLGA